MRSTCQKFQEICTKFRKLKIVFYERKIKRAKKIEICWRKIIVTNNCLLHIKFIGKIKYVQKNRKLLVD